MLTLTLHLYDDSANPLRQYACRNTNQPGIVYTHVASRQDVINEIGRIRRLGLLVELWLHLHGSPGVVRTQSVLLQSFAFDASTVYLLRNVCFNAMPALATVYWLCSDLGQGPAGDAFLRAAGPAMLSRGGVLYPRLR
ncbi:hypothetical protein FHP25_32695 [Vineibacter terrae]|uniref:Uncharacterized protein n=1 Tax=Vineibacter terrae TaxID=2586908 RepID=A0A5C8PB17_9HYPH|nr:hypothetical protein [Vineibacter terrae]TXL70880.1 hypothetical protein FHP25_32695 [Vineibacter terrae]